MKKILTFLTMVGTFMVFPSISSAMVELDENGNPIIPETNEGEVRILSVQDDNNDYSDEENAEDIAKITSEDDRYYITGDSEKSDEDNKILYVSVSSIVGLAIVSIGTYLFTNKKQ